MIAAYASYLAQGGHQVVLRTNLLDTVFALDPGVSVERISLRGKGGTILSLLAAPAGADLVVVDIIAMAFFASLRNRNRVLYFAQDYNENLYRSPVQKLFIRLLYAISLRWFKVPVVAVSDELARLFRERFGAPARVLLNGVDLKSFYPDPCSELRREKGERKALLIFSRRDARKGFDLALATIARVAAAGIPLVVWTVGEPLDDGEAGCSRRDFGYVPEHELRRIMSSADLFLYPSRSEGFPLMVLEAFACRCPVVTTEAIPYAIDGVNSLVAPVGDLESLVAKACRLLNGAALANELADNAASFVLRYSLARSAQKFEAAVTAEREK